MSPERPGWRALNAVAAQADWWLDGPLLRPLRRIAGALVVAAGPWLLAIITLLVIGRATVALLGAEALEDMRLAVVYAFMLAPLVAAPVGVIAARTITDAASRPGTAAVGALLLVSCGIAGVCAQVLALGAALALGLSDPGLTVAFAVLTASSAMVWTAFPVLAACGARHRLILSFAVGMGGALVLSFAVADHARSAADVVWCFTTGVAVCLALSIAPFGSAALEPGALGHAFRRLRSGARVTWPLGLGAALAIAGVWADKWVVWLGPGGQISAAGFRHLPSYDGAMFLAQLSAVPGLAALTLHFEGPVRDAMARFRARLTRGATLASAESAATAVSTTVWTGILRIMVATAALSGVLVLLAPVIAAKVELRLDQFLILRMGIVSALLHSLFLAASGILILCNRKMAFALLQAAFLLANLCLSALLTLQIGITSMGFALASAICVIGSVLVAFGTIRRIIQYCFLNGNDALFETNRH